jgi:hypothetical protein
MVEEWTTYMYAVTWLEAKVLKNCILGRKAQMFFYIPIVCVPELHKYGIANRLHTHLLYGHFQDIWKI